jgi:hypothetical protein
MQSVSSILISLGFTNLWLLFFRADTCVRLTNKWKLPYWRHPVDGVMISRRDDALARNKIIERVAPCGQWRCNGVRPSQWKNTGGTILWLCVPRGCGVVTLGSTYHSLPALLSAQTFPFFPDFFVLCMFVSFFCSFLQKTCLVWSPNTTLKTTSGHNWCTCILAWRCPFVVETCWSRVHPRTGHEDPEGE